MQRRAHGVRKCMFLSKNLETSFQKTWAKSSALMQGIATAIAAGPVRLTEPDQLEAGLL